MTLRTGNGSQYRYYTCSTKARQGEASCSRLTVPMDKLDRAVADHLEWCLLDPQRLMAMKNQVLEHRQEWNDRRRGHIAELRIAGAEAKLKRRYEAIENGVINAADLSLKDRIADCRRSATRRTRMPNARLRRLNVLDRPSRQRAFAGSRRARGASCETKMEHTGETICGPSPSVLRSSVRARFASSARKPNFFGHLSQA